MKLEELDAKQRIIRRSAGLFIIIALCFLGLVTRLGYLQLHGKTRYTNLALGQRLRPQTIDAQRGVIYDRNYKVLAMSADAYSIYVIPSEERNSAETAEKLAPYLSMPQTEIKHLLDNSTSNFYLARKLNPSVASAIKELAIPGIRLLSRPQRFYPQGTLAAHVLGIAGIDNQGLEGLEFYYDEYLRGIPGRLELERDASNRTIPGGIQEITLPQNGKDLVLTMDSVIQYIAEKEIRSAVISTRSTRGIIFMVNPKTGEILANAIYPSFDPNDYQAYPAENRRNVGITDQFEPGSTFKIFTASAALDLGITDLEREFFSGSSWSVGGGVVRSWNGYGHGQITFQQAMEISDNITFAKLAVEMEPENFHSYLNKFGFGQKSGLDFPGEISGMLPKPGETKYGETIQWANIGFGQGIAVTPLQLVMATAAVANGGKLLQPYYVAEIHDEYGKIITRTQPQVIREVVSENTAAIMGKLLRSTVENGTAGRAEVIGFRVAGKTGTAEVPEKGGYGDERIASFVGYAPVDDPEVAVLVALFHPQTDNRYGGVLTAPVFQTVVEQTLEYLKVQRIHPSLQKDSMAVVPNVRNLPIQDGKNALAQRGLQWSYELEGDIIMDQIPSPGSKVPPRTTVNLFFYDEANLKHITVPNLVGRSMRDVSTIISELGLRLRVTGSGMAIRQTLPAGSQVPVGSVIEVEFIP